MRPALELSVCDLLVFSCRKSQNVNTLTSAFLKKENFMHDCLYTHFLVGFSQMSSIPLWSQVSCIFKVEIGTCPSFWSKVEGQSKYEMYFRLG